MGAIEILMAGKLSNLTFLSIQRVKIYRTVSRQENSMREQQGLDSTSKAKTVEVSESLEKGSDRMCGPKSKHYLQGQQRQNSRVQQEP